MQLSADTAIVTLQRAAHRTDQASISQRDLSHQSTIASETRVEHEAMKKELSKAVFTKKISFLTPNSASTWRLSGAEVTAVRFATRGSLGSRSASGGRATVRFERPLRSFSDASSFAFSSASFFSCFSLSFAASRFCATSACENCNSALYSIVSFEVRPMTTRYVRNVSSVMRTQHSSSSSSLFLLLLLSVHPLAF